jgi:PTS system cellobiose-specific IIC component
MSLTSAIENKLIPVAVKMNDVKGIAAVRDAFIQIFPLTLAGSLAVMINSVFLSSTGFIGQFLVHAFPNIDKAQAVLDPVFTGSIVIMSLLIVFLVAKNFADLYKVDSTKAGITALAVFFIFYPEQVSIENFRGFTSGYLGAQGLFVAIFIGLLTGWFFYKLSGIQKLQINLPGNIPPEILKTFISAIPVVIIVVVASVINYLILLISPEGINALIYSVIQAPLTALSGNVITSFVLIFIATILWVFGIHGTATISPIYKVMFAEANIMNMQYAATAGTCFGAPYPLAWIPLFENFGATGGTGNTFGLVLAILILSLRKNWKRRDYTSIAKLGLLPALFGINEPMIFGLPIVLNPVLAIPFILSPLVNMIVGAIEIALGLVPPGILDVGWTTPQPIKAFLSTAGAWQSVVAQLVAIFISVLIYMPFVIAANNAAQKGNTLQEK